MKVVCIDNKNYLENGISGLTKNKIYQTLNNNIELFWFESGFFIAITDDFGRKVIYWNKNNGRIRFISLIEHRKQKLNKILK